MAADSQQGNVELLSALSGLTHEIFVGNVADLVRHESETAKLFKEATPGEDFRFSGEKMVFAVDLRFKQGGVPTSGHLPDYVPMDAVNGEQTPTRRYARLAIDNQVEMLASGEGAFEDLGARIQKKLWQAWKYMEIANAVGGSSGVVCLVDARTSSTVFTVKDGYGHTGTNPISLLSENVPIGWWDVDQAQVGGAANVTNTGINYSNDTITVDSAATWETEVGNQIVGDDLIYYATTNDTTSAHFELSRNLSPSGVGTVLDPNGDLTTVFNISETTYRRWKPFRKVSSTFDHLEFTEFALKLGVKCGIDVTPEDYCVVTHPSCAAQMARSLIGFQQQAYTGGELSGGYTAVTVAGHRMKQDPFFYHDVAAFFNYDSIYRVDIGGEADFWSGDGSMWHRIADYDGRTAFAGDYMNYLCNHRGANGALTNIKTPDVNVSDFDTVPDY